MDMCDQTFPKRQEGHWSRSSCGETSSLNEAEFHFHFKRNQTDPAAACPWSQPQNIYIFQLLFHLLFRLSARWILLCPPVVRSVCNIAVWRTQSPWQPCRWGTWCEKKFERYLRSQSCCETLMRTYLKFPLSFFGSNFQRPHSLVGVWGHPAGWTEHMSDNSESCSVLNYLKPLTSILCHLPQSAR